MDQLFYLLCFLLVAAARTHAALPPELYWKSVLPNTRMPAAISDLLSSAQADEKVDVNAGKRKPGGTLVNARKASINVNAKKGKPGSTNGKASPSSTDVNVGPIGAMPHLSRGQVFLYEYAANATEKELHDDPNVALYFVGKDLYIGTKLTVHFTKTNTAGATFLPRKVADSIPFSSKQLPEILTRFAVKPGSHEAAVMKQTLHDCEQKKPVELEKKLCVTSLESMIDFATSILGTRHVQTASTVVGKAGTPKQQYTVTSVRELAGVNEIVACHAEAYVYAVFICHLTRSTREYTVSMIGKDGTAVKAVVVCHTDTAAWNPRNAVLQALKVAPGTVPICHFLPEDNIVWSHSG